MSGRGFKKEESTLTKGHKRPREQIRKASHLDEKNRYFTDSKNLYDFYSPNPNGQAPASRTQHPTKTQLKATTTQVSRDNYKSILKKSKGYMPKLYSSNEKKKRKDGKSVSPSPQKETLEKEATLS